MKFILPLLLAISVSAQSPSAPSSPGQALFRSNCAFCHGLTATGGRGPSLVTSELVRAGAPDALQKVIRGGVPGTSMPAFSDFTDTQLGQLVDFLKGLAVHTVKQGPIPGNAERGKQIYAANGCSGCHQINSSGSVFGPDLSRVGAARPAEYIQTSITDPSADVPIESEGVMVVTNDGKHITGVLVNRDTFTVQLRDTSQRFRMFQNDQVREVRALTKSLMPPYQSFSATDLQDLVKYLTTLRSPAEKSAVVTTEEGIK